MGGTVALTIRVSPEQAYRGSCWTNILPEGLFAAPFYVDLDTSRAHATAWLEQLLTNRRADPKLEKMWGGHGMLAPVAYGLIVVDYVTRTLISAQGYCAVDELYSTGRDADKDAKWAALEKAGLLMPPRTFYPPSWKAASIKLPFTHTVISDVDKIDASLLHWCEENFGLSDAERAAWAVYLEYQ